jgi:glycosyltransferase involved in cell wall biosynthesis
MNNIKCTLLVTNYNYSKWLRRCLRSCINQSQEDYEIIIVDDFSTDDSRKILRDYEDLPNLKIIYNERNMGIGYSANKGARLALGKWIVRVDSDDYIHSDFLKCLLLYAEFNKSHAVATDYQCVDFNEKVLSVNNQESDPIACGILYRTDVLEYIGSWNPSLTKNEDVDILKRFKKDFNMDYLNIPLYRYFKHENSLSSENS